MGDSSRGGTFQLSLQERLFLQQKDKEKRDFRLRELGFPPAHPKPQEPLDQAQLQRLRQLAYRMAQKPK